MRRRRRVSRLRGLARAIHWSLRILVLLLIADLVYVATLWPDWERLANGPIPRSEFMLQYEQARTHQDWPKLQWRPVSFNQVPHHLVRAVLVAEDARFYGHAGFDFEALRDAWDHNLAEGRLVFGGSTISQQTAKNLFLAPDRTPLRKWHEILFTIALERTLRKQRILEIYLNIAEFGRGVYGVEAAARHYWGVSVSDLSVTQAAELAATLPGPTKHNPRSRTKYFTKRSQKIMGYLAREFELESTPLPPLPAGFEQAPGIPESSGDDMEQPADSLSGDRRVGL